MIGGFMGHLLLQELAKATGLPESIIKKELSELISKSGKSIDQTTLDDLREILADYLQDVLNDAKKELTL